MSLNLFLINRHILGERERSRERERETDGGRKMEISRNIFKI